MSTERNKSAHSPDAHAGAKRAYVKPAFRHETVFEVMALACGKVGAVSGPCNSNKKLS